MREIIVIIGGQYGDEGKGLLTSYYCEKYEEQHPIVVRFSGSAQAGHTVVYNGKKHVFSHFGSGSLQGIRTFLSKEFVCHPMLFRKEREILVRKGIFPSIGVDPNCDVITPYDMLYNQFLEDCRGIDRHGSCGIGFGCAVTRAEVIPFRVFHLVKPRFEDILQAITEYYCEVVNNIHGDNNIKKIFLSKMADISVDKFWEDCHYFISHSYCSDDYTYLNQFTPIFEGSQGLLLDPKYGDFPHVTRKSVGVEEAFSIIDKLSDDYHVHVNYLTRPYITKHGNGPLPYENSTIGQLFNIVDETNVYNKYQGRVRYAPFSLSEFNDQITRDYMSIVGGKKYTKLSKVMTCVDQITEFTQFPFNIEEEFHIISRGPSHSDVEEIF